MRTTLTLDDDVAALLKRVQRRRRWGLKAAVNEGLRRGLLAIEEPSKPARPYRTPSVSIGRCLIGNLDDVSEALAIGEGEQFK